MVLWSLLFVHGCLAAGSCRGGGARGSGGGGSGGGANGGGASIYDGEDEDDDEDDEEDDEELLLRGGAEVPVGARSTSGSSLGRVGGLVGGLVVADAVAIGPSDMGGSCGGSSICMWSAMRCSSGVGRAPISAYRDHFMLCWLMIPESLSTS